MDVSEHQRKLSAKAEREPGHKFGDLFNLISDPRWLDAAFESVRRNAGSVTAGVDGVRAAEFQRDRESNIARLSRELRDGAFGPHPVRRVHIAKSNGKVRPLGIPSVRDRVVQEALRMALEPIFEADFSRHSYGFRPTRSTHDAVKAASAYITNRTKYFWVIEGDISS